MGKTGKEREKMEKEQRKKERKWRKNCPSSLLHSPSSKICNINGVFIHKHCKTCSKRIESKKKDSELKGAEPTSCAALKASAKGRHRSPASAGIKGIRGNIVKTKKDNSNPHTLGVYTLPYSALDFSVLKCKFVKSGKIDLSDQFQSSCTLL